MMPDDDGAVGVVAARGLLRVIDIPAILVLFFFGLWSLTIQLLVLTVIVLLFTGEKKKDELS
jgi:hypothetical protein